MDGEIRTATLQQDAGGQYKAGMIVTTDRKYPRMADSGPVWVDPVRMQAWADTPGLLTFDEPPAPAEPQAETLEAAPAERPASKRSGVRRSHFSVDEEKVKAQIEQVLAKDSPTDLNEEDEPK